MSSAPCSALKHGPRPYRAMTVPFASQVTPRHALQAVGWEAALGVLRAGHERERERRASTERQGGGARGGKGGRVVFSSGSRGAN